MAYTGGISRIGSSGNINQNRVGGALVSEVVSKDIIQGAIEQSAALKLMKRVDMGTNQTRMPVLASFPAAFWITGATLEDRDIGLKQATTMSWDNVYLNAEEIAVLVPIPNNLIADTKYPLWEMIKPRIREAIGLKIDETVLFGVDKPASFPTAIAVAAIARGNSVVAGTSSIDVVDDINEVWRSVETDGYSINGTWARTNLKGRLRGLRTSTREMLGVSETQSGLQGNPTGTLFDEKVVYSTAGFSAFATGAYNAGTNGVLGVSLISGDWDQAILGIRQDIQMETFDTGVITDGAGNIIYNLLQQDMKVLRVIWRGGFCVPNPINRVNRLRSSSSSTTVWDAVDTAGNGYPFGVLKQNAGGTGE